MIKKIRSSQIIFVLCMWVNVSCTGIKSSSVKENPAAQSTQKNEDWWNERHQTIINRLQTNPELILVGNSIFHSLEEEDRKEVKAKYLDRYRTLNMGISGDRTENVIWRLENGALEGISPKIAIVLIGTNNTDGNHYLNISTPTELADGIYKICDLIHSKLPDTEILLMGILPYGYNANLRNNTNKATNQLISAFPEKNPKIHYIDIGSEYIDKNGKVNKELMPDYLHPNAEGHMLMFKALDSKIQNLMK
ncbi:GDSL-type esterase/lipase family protein [Zobellia uliginosa]|uniref:GDSL-type esterase/lipase family protein n=1 Tax=Zobellia uliginosa TaxID=143224 RepID=UPI001C069D67|nr:GDSL-type esterase/lipase family protein [Zobellia uliginosa]MBU2945745.1 hypothetical protein [Zobellia uliginosa]